MVGRKITREPNRRRRRTIIGYFVCVAGELVARGVYLPRTGTRNGPVYNNIDSFVSKLRQKRTCSNPTKVT